ncbi:MAG: FecR family protein [Tannerellaceae bacterium]|nr:FecR family protein [Tannerellaceae bacterium]
MSINQEILLRYFLGQSSEDEKENIHQWLESDEAHKKKFVRERIRFDASLMVDDQELLTPTRQFSFSGSRWTLIKVAAAVLLLLGSSFLFQFYLSPSEKTTLQSIYVPAGSRTSVTLPDGTSAWLNSNTVLTYPNSFPKNNRMVLLNGEAYFDVTKDENRSFIVKTSKYNVEVLGTVFDVEAYEKEDLFKTTLYSGKVRLYKEEQEEDALYLNAGEVAELIDGHLVVSLANSYSYRWKEGLIILEGQSFRDIMRLFEKYFDMRIIIQNEKVMELGYEGKLRIVDGIDHALRVLQNDFRFTYSRDTETNVIHIY